MWQLAPWDLLAKWKKIPFLVNGTCVHSVIPEPANYLATPVDNPQSQMKFCTSCWKKNPITTVIHPVATVSVLILLQWQFLPFACSLSEPSQVEVRLLLAYSSPVTSLSPPFSPSKLGWSDSIDSLPATEATVEGAIPFSKTVKVYIMPKPARRWRSPFVFSHAGLPPPCNTDL